MPDPEPALSGALLATAEWIAGYYAAPLGLTLKSILPGGHVGRVAGHRLAAERIARLPAASRARCWPGWSGAAGKRPVSTAARALKRPLWDVIERLTRIDAVTLRVQPPDTSAGRAHRAGALPDGGEAHPARAGGPLQAAAQAAAALRNARGAGWKRVGPASLGAARLRRRRAQGAGARGTGTSGPLGSAPRSFRRLTGLTAAHRAHPRPVRWPSPPSRRSSPEKGLSCSASPEAARRWSISKPCGGCWRRAGAPSCSFRRSVSRRRR